MTQSLTKRRDFWAGLMFVGFGVATIWIGSSYSMGTARAMGPGYFPFLLGCVLCFLGACIALRKGEEDERAFERVRLRPFLSIVAVIAFGLLIPHAGLVLSIFALIIIGAAAGKEFHFIEVIALAAFMSLFCVAVFNWGLGLYVPLWP